MKIRLAVVLVGLALGFDVPTFAQQKEPTPSEQCRQQLDAFDKKLTRDSTTAMPPALAAFYTAIKRSKLESKPACGHSRCVKNWRWPRVNSGTLICAENKS